MKKRRGTVENSIEFWELDKLKLIKRISAGDKKEDIKWSLWCWGKRYIKHIQVKEYSAS